MLRTEFFIPTQKEVPAEATLVSHRLMLRAGMIRQAASGLYHWLPLGLRVLRKVEAIVREEMDRAGAVELLMPMVQPANLWEESGRWGDYGPELLRFKDRHERDFCLGPTHEEVIVDLMRHSLKSYKELSKTFYQIQTKFRDEIRPRFGVMRGREFLMKDAYSFDADAEGMQGAYDTMFEAYQKIFTRLGLNFRAVLADTGSIGGSFSHEFQVLAESGEDLIAYSDGSDYAANVERAEALAPEEQRPEPRAPLEKFATPGVKTIEELSDKHGVAPENSLKTLMVRGAEVPIVVLILRGDHTLNEIKASNLAEVASPLEFLNDQEVHAALGCGFGSLGPVGLSIPVIVDRDAACCADFSCGANEEGFHIKHVNWERDVALGTVVDLRDVMEGDKSPDGKGDIKFARGIEVGHVFQLGDKYSRAMKMTILNEKGQSVAPQMGCYGIGVSRIVGAAIEQNHDEAGILWPEALAPFDIGIVPIQFQKSYRVREACENLVEALESAGFSVLLDDRKDRPGVMFAEMDLIGVPWRVVISERGLDDNTVEIKRRGQTDPENCTLESVVAKIKERA